MSTHLERELRVEKRRSEAIIRLTTGETVSGNFFTGDGSARHAGPERIGDLLNADSGFFPFEVLGESGPRTMIYNRAHVVIVTVSNDEPSQDPGYNVATRRTVCMRVSTGERLAGAICVYRPEGHNRLSDWSKSRDQFHYLETETSTFLVNSAHIVEVSEALKS